MHFSFFSFDTLTESKILGLNRVYPKHVAIYFTCLSDSTQGDADTLKHTHSRYIHLCQTCLSPLQWDFRRKFITHLGHSLTAYGLTH